MYGRTAPADHQRQYERNPTTNYHNQQPAYIPPQQQQQQQNDGKNQIYSSQQHHLNQNIYVSTNPFITTPRSNYSPSSFGKDTTHYSPNTSNFILNLFVGSEF